MNMNLSNFKLLKEDNSSYQVGHPNGKAMVIPKAGLSDKAHEVIKKMKSAHFDEGGETSVDESAPVQPAIEAPSATAPADTSSQMSPNQAQDIDRSIASSSPTGLEQKISGIQAEANAQGNQGNQEAQAIENFQNQSAALPTQEDVIKQNQAKNDALEKSIKDLTIDPNRYWHDKSTGSKVLAGLGMLFSGMGSATAGQPNYAIENINKAIERDMESQRNDQSKAMNLWKMNKEALGTNLAANLATKNQLETGLKFQIMKAGAQAQNPIAQAKAQQAIGDINGQIAQRNALLGLHSVVTGQAQPGNEQEYINAKNQLQILDPAMAKEADNRYLPGVGVARTDVKPEDRDAFTHFDAIQKLIDKAKGFMATEGTTYNPLGSANTEAKDIQSQILLHIGQLVGLQRIPPFAADAIKEMVKSPGALNQAQAKKSYEGLEDALKIQKQSVANKLGVMPFKQLSPNQQAAQWVQQNANNPDPVIRQKAALVAQKLQSGGAQ